MDFFIIFRISIFLFISDFWFAFSHLLLHFQRILWYCYYFCNVEVSFSFSFSVSTERMCIHYTKTLISFTFILFSTSEIHWVSQSMEEHLFEFKSIQFIYLHITHLAQFETLKMESHETEEIQKGNEKREKYWNCGNKVTVAVTENENEKEIISATLQYNLQSTMCSTACVTKTEYWKEK